MREKAAAGLAATALVVGAAVTGCGGGASPGPTSSTSSSSSAASAPQPSSAPPPAGSVGAQSPDYGNLLIKPGDIVVPGETFALLQSVPVPGPAGVNGLFMNQGGSRKLDVTLYVYPDPGAAGQARDMAVQTMTDPDIGVTGGSPTPVDVGGGGTIAIGTANKHDGPVSKAMVMFVEGKVFADLEFESPPNDPPPRDVVLDIARKQDAAIKAGLPA